MQLLQSDTIDPVSTLCQSDFTAHEQISQASPLCVGILQTVSGISLGTKLGDWWSNPLNSPASGSATQTTHIS